MFFEEIHIAWYQKARVHFFYELLLRSFQSQLN